MLMGSPLLAEGVLIPQWVRDLTSFRRWARSDGFPKHWRIAFLGGDLWVDRTMEIILHGKVKMEVSRVVDTLVREGGLGDFLPDGTRLSHLPAGLSTEPDGLFVSGEALDEGRVMLAEGDESLEVEGTPDMVLEVVSASSVEKDTVLLRERYRKAGIPEYWLIDPRGEDWTFDILRAGPRGYLATRKQGGWMKSVVFRKSFRLTRSADERGHHQFTLEVR
jgi:Uma2 family endonuclease